MERTSLDVLWTAGVLASDVWQMTVCLPAVLRYALTDDMSEMPEDGPGFARFTLAFALAHGPDPSALGQSTPIFPTPTLHLPALNEKAPCHV